MCPGISSDSMETHIPYWFWSHLLGIISCLDAKEMPSHLCLQVRGQGWLWELGVTNFVSFLTPTDEVLWV